MKRLIFLLAVAPASAAAQSAPPEMVLMPRVLVQAALNWIAQPDPVVAVKLFAQLNACLQDNVQDAPRTLPDQCAPVTEALAAREKELADLRAQVNSTTGPREVPK
jgi:hypothetical protein